MGSRKISIERLKDMPLKEYTALLVRDMVAALNVKTKRKEKQERGKANKR